MSILIREANRDHFSALRTIELASFETLRAAGAVTGEATASSDGELQQYLQAGFLAAETAKGLDPLRRVAMMLVF